METSGRENAGVAAGTGEVVVCFHMTAVVVTFCYGVCGFGRKAMADARSLLDGGKVLSIEKEDRL